MKRRWRVSTALAASAFTLAALGTAGMGAVATNASAAAKTTTTLTLWQDGSVASSASYLPDLIASFEHSHPGVKVNVVAEPSGNYFALLQTSFISKTAPDIADLFAGTYLSGLEPYMTNLKSYIPATLVKTAKGMKYYAQNENINRALYGVPSADQFYNGFYNKALFRKAGIKSFPTTWSQLFAACSTLKSHGIEPMSYSLNENGAHEDWSYLASAIALSNWNSLLNDKLSYADPTLIYQVQQWAMLYKNGCTNHDPVTSTTAQQAFSTGKSAMYVGGSWLIPPFQSLGANLGVMIPPYSKSPQRTIVEMPGGGYGVPSSSQHVALAAEFLTYMLSEKGQQIIASSGQPPVISMGVKLTNPAMKQLIALADSGKYVQYPMFDNYTQPSVATAINNEMNLAFVGQTSAKAALSNLESTQAALPAKLRNINYRF
jgi:ABC-type glycerol-3-phosphate transport system substrate-binding protein